MPTLTATEAQAIARRILRSMGAGRSREDRRRFTRRRRSGETHPNHGMAKLLDYRSRVERGALDPAALAVVTQGQAAGPVVAVDGARGFGHPAAKLLISTMVDRLQSEPVVVGGLSRASHTGRLDPSSTPTGAPTTDPAAVLSGGMLTTFGGHKGYVLSLVVALLAGGLVGASVPDFAGHGLLAIVLRPDLFADADVVASRLEAELDHMRSTPARGGHEGSRCLAIPNAGIRARPTVVSTYRTPS